MQYTYCWKSQIGQFTVFGRRSQRRQASAVRIVLRWWCSIYLQIWSSICKIVIDNACTQPIIGLNNLLETVCKRWAFVWCSVQVSNVAIYAERIVSLLLCILLLLCYVVVVQWVLAMVSTGWQLMAAVAVTTWFIGFIWLYLCSCYYDYLRLCP